MKAFFDERNYYLCMFLIWQVSVNGLDKAGSTPLHWAAQGGHTGVCEAVCIINYAHACGYNKL